MSSAKTPEAAFRERIYQEGQRAYSQNLMNPYTDWRAKTWAKGRQAASDYYAQLCSDSAEQAKPLHTCPACGYELHSDEIPILENTTKVQKS